MADMSQVNLERLRGTDAMWEETKHPRADNGQFTSGSGGGGAKVMKATPGMTGGKFGTEKSRIHQEVVKNNRRVEATQAKMDEALKNKDRNAYWAAWREKNEGAGKSIENIKNIKKTFQAAGKTLAKARPGIAKMREQAKAESPDIKAMETAIEKKTAEYKDARNRYAPVDQIRKLREELDQMKFDYRAARFPRQYGSKSAQPAAKPQASHPMAGEVQRDIDYWHQMQYGGRPSEKQKQDTIESMRMQYDDYLKSAEKNWKLAQSVPNLDEATRNKYKQKYETAKGKVEALKQMHG